MADRAASLIDRRREELSRVLERPLPEPAPSGPVAVSEAVTRHLLEEAEELYWNEMAWEQLTGEEGVGEHALPEMTFPGFMAFVRGLLLEETLPDAKAPARPRPDVVDEILLFLAGRILELQERLADDDVDDESNLEAELTMTTRLMDLVLYRYHGLSPADVERLEAAQVRH